MNVDLAIFEPPAMAGGNCLPRRGLKAAWAVARKVLFKGRSGLSGRTQAGSSTYDRQCGEAMNSSKMSGKYRLATNSGTHGRASRSEASSDMTERTKSSLERLFCILGHSVVKSQRASSSSSIPVHCLKERSKKAASIARL